MFSGLVFVLFQYLQIFQFFLFRRFSNLESDSCQLSVLISSFPRFGNPEPGSCLLSFSKVLVIQRPDILSERAGYVRSDPTTSAQCSFDPWTSTFEFDGLPTELPSYLVQGSIKMQELTAKMQIRLEINIIIWSYLKGIKCYTFLRKKKFMLHCRL